jgi:hypothetical protein
MRHRLVTKIDYTVYSIILFQNEIDLGPIRIVLKSTEHVQSE